MKASPIAVLFALAGIAAAWPQASVAQSVRYRIVPEESEARYRVRERIARLEFPTDAVGTTKEITGKLTLDGDGGVASSSRFELDGRCAPQPASHVRDTRIPVDRADDPPWRYKGGRLAALLSVTDDIRLELDLVMALVKMGVHDRRVHQGSEIMSSGKRTLSAT